jgi:hypothetical protein
MNQSIPCPTIFPALSFTYRRNLFGMRAFYFQGTSCNSGNGSFGAMTLQSQLGANKQPPGELRDGQELGRKTLAPIPSHPNLELLSLPMQCAVLASGLHGSVVWHVKYYIYLLGMASM